MNESTSIHVWRIRVRFVSFILGVTVAGLGLLAMVWPEVFHGFLRDLRTHGGMYAAAGFRLALGASLMMAAPTSRFPATILIFGWVFLVGGVFLPLVGFGFFRSVLEWFVSLDHLVTRVWGVISFVLGLFLSYSLAPWFRSPAS